MLTKKTDIFTNNVPNINECKYTFFINTIKAQGIYVASIEPTQSFLNLYIDYFFYYILVIFIRAPEALYWFYGCNVCNQSK